MAEGAGAQWVGQGMLLTSCYQCQCDGILGGKTVELEYLENKPEKNRRERERRIKTAKHKLGCETLSPAWLQWARMCQGILC